MTQPVLSSHFSLLRIEFELEALTLNIFSLLLFQNVILATLSFQISLLTQTRSILRLYYFEITPVDSFLLLETMYMYKYTCTSCIEPL